jgi:hypothetical protein
MAELDQRSHQGIDVQNSELKVGVSYLQTHWRELRSLALQNVAQVARDRDGVSEDLLQVEFGDNRVHRHPLVNQKNTSLYL